MPIYEYACANEKCETDTFLTHQSFKDEPLEICPFCEGRFLRRLISVPTVIVKNQNTLGSVADKNTSELGLYERQEKNRQLQESRLNANKYVGKVPDGATVVEKKEFTPFWRDGPIDTKLAKMTPEQSQKYIITGKKPL